ncbi:MAG TPA: glycosyltransferase family 4 protein [Flavobacteriales bacterium]
MDATYRITWITHYAELYGANRSMLDLMLELRRRGIAEPTVILPREGPLGTALVQEGIAHTVIDLRPWMSERTYMGGPHHRVMQYLRYRKAARERAAHNRAMLPLVLAQLRTWGSDAVHLNSAAVPMGAAIQQHSGLPLIWHIRELPEDQYLLHLDSGRRAYGRALRSADRLIAISKAVRTDIHRYTGQDTDIPVIYNGVLRTADHVRLAQRASERHWDGVVFNFCLIGLIHPSKGQIEAVEALALVRRKHPEARLIIAGTGRDQELRATIERTGQAEAVEMAGFVSDPFSILERSHTLLMCSRNEAMGRVTVEAMASGIPVIGHASGGTTELVEHGINGYRYTEGAAELADRMMRMIEHPEMARQLGAKGAEMAAERFTIERYANEIAKVYDAVFSRA